MNKVIKNAIFTRVNQYNFLTSAVMNTLWRLLNFYPLDADVVKRIKRCNVNLRIAVAGNEELEEDLLLQFLDDRHEAVIETLLGNRSFKRFDLLKDRIRNEFSWSHAIMNAIRRRGWE